MELESGKKMARMSRKVTSLLKSGISGEVLYNCVRWKALMGGGEGQRRAAGSLLSPPSPSFPPGAVPPPRPALVHGGAIACG
ncbi:hypothetical protein E2C01_036857 [Portunus trituberculatus]|uniref:Uncharacterized protein n=1 Tax=Portunus trituberculatus TaxID=210409 RepID=A0A5B7FCC9_PORTR|nr:hypothetical protein [Portunus trituberculatus]